MSIPVIEMTTPLCATSKMTGKGVSPQACKGMLSTLLTAQSTGKKIATYYTSHTCSTLPYYGSAPGPVYVGIVND